MRTCGYIFLALLAAWPSAPALGQAQPAEPIFARAGGKAFAPAGFGKQHAGQIVLRAFGRTWTKPFPANGPAEFDVPNVRVPTIFSITPADNETPVLGEVVAYPAQDVTWDKKLVLYTCGTPKWFDQWAAATGLTVNPVGLTDKLPAVDPDEAKGWNLLILGRSAAGKSPAEVLKLARQKDVNILVIEADWFGAPAGAAAVAPGGMRYGLADIGRQKWPQPLKFTTHRRPWSGIANRWAWIVDEQGLPLVEAVANILPPPDSMRPVLLSYMPWPRQLGRSESADATLLALLAAAAKAPSRAMGVHPVRFIYPEKKDLDRKTRPVLAAVFSVDEEPRALEDKKPSDHPSVCCIVDLRGGERLDVKHPELSEQCRNCAAGQAVNTVVILGDSPMLDEWKWLKIDRAKKTIRPVQVRFDVLWLPDNDLPPSGESQIKLMLALTRLGVLLAPPGRRGAEKMITRKMVCGMVILAVAAMLWGAGAARAAESDKPAEKALELRSINVAVFDFDVLKGVDLEPAALTDQVNTMLATLDKVTIVNRDQIKKVADEHKIALSGLVDSASAAQLGKFLSANYVIVGRASRIGQTNYLVLKIVDVETTVQTTVSAKAETENGLEALLARLKSSLDPKIRELQKPVAAEEDKALAKVRPAAKSLAGKVVLIDVTETHVNRPLVDPAARMAIASRLKALGIETIVPKDPVDDWKQSLLETGKYGDKKIDFLLEGEGTSAFAAQMQGLISCRARVELRLIAVPGRAVTVSDKGVGARVDLVEALAAKAALEDAGKNALDAVILQWADEVEKNKDKAKVEEKK